MRVEMGLDPCVRLALAREAARSLVCLGQLRGASVKTERRIARAAAVLVGAVGLVGSVPLVEVAHAATPQFQQFPFNLTNVGNRAKPTFVDIDGDGDLDAFIGNSDGNTIFFRNTGSSSAPAFASPSANPFGLADVGYDSSPTFADIDGDGDLDAFIGNRDGDTIFFENTGSSNAPAFASPSTNPFGLADVGYTASPTFVDIDGDGDLDAFIGEFYGKTRFFRNTGSSSAPAFAALSTNPFGLAVGAYVARPAFADIDGDGDLDAFIGEIYGNTIFFRNTGSSSAPAFAASSANPFGLADVGYFASPTFADIDGDGDLDAFIGNSDGNTLFFRNTGSSSAPAFAASSANPFGLADVGYFASPTFADIDGDGDLDAFIGNGAGDTIFFENTGSSSAPAFAAASTNPFSLADVGYNSSPVFVDIDGDGDLDAFIGNSDGNTIFFRNTGSSSAPAFAASSANPFGLADVGSYSTPEFADIDGDGDLDAFIGNEDGNTIFFRNTGSGSAPAFASPSTNPFGLADVGDTASPTFVDIDGDGDLDAFIGEFFGSTIFFENTGSSSAPAFAAASTNPFGLADVGRGRSSPAFADIDGEGDLDAFIGEFFGNTIFFENIGCGNGGLDAGEECDDGNAVGGDGCSASCMLEGTPPPTPTSTPSHTPTPSVTPTPTSTPSHTPTPSVTPTPADNDNDGVPDAVENAGPNGGDGNGDGTPDSQQPHVASLPGARGGGAYQTMVTDSACPIRNLAAVALSPPGFNLPFGALAFELPGCESTRVTIYYHGVDSLSAPPMEYVKQGPNPPGASNNVVYTLSSGAPHTLTFGSANLGFDTAVGFASFTLSDNVVGDDTGDDGVIVDQGGPGFSTAAPVPVASGWGVLGSLLMLLGVGWRRLWRR